MCVLVLAYMLRLRERSIWNVNLRIFPTGSIAETEKRSGGVKMCSVEGGSDSP